MAGPAGERFEWLETWKEPEAPAARSDRQAQLARRCPRCRWLDAVTEAECFRCGYVFDEILKLIEKGPSGPAASSIPTHSPSPNPSSSSNDRALEPITIRFADASALLEGSNDSAALFALRRSILERGLVPGFERLLSLSEVNLDFFQHFEHQREVALRALRDMGGCALLADETGLGKTIEAGLIAKELFLRGLARSLLIVVPASLTMQWHEELNDKLGFEACIVRSNKDYVNEPPVVICSYATIRSERVGQRLRERPWDLLICDEAHYLKNRSTRQYKSVNRIAKKYVLLLSATPFHNKLVELKNLLDLLKPGLLGSTRAFNKQYVDKTDPRRPLNVHHLKTILGEVMIRHRRSKVLIQLPPRRACIIHLELNELERSLYDDVSRFISDEVRHLLGRYKPNKSLPMGRLGQHRFAFRKGVKAYSHVLSLINLQREACSSPAALMKTLKKMSEDHDHPVEVRAQLTRLADRAATIIEPTKTRAVFRVLEEFEGKLVIFCEYLATIDDLAARLREKGIDPVIFDGRQSILSKQRVLKEFKADKRVLLASRAGGEGLNIQFCQNMINYDLPWNPMAVEQRIGRLHRLGQTGDVRVFNLSVKDTIEARVLELLTHKIRMFSTVIGEIDLILGQLAEDQGFEQLLRDAWLESQLSGAEAASFNRLGGELESARKAFESMQENAGILDSLNP